MAFRNLIILLAVAAAIAGVAFFSSIEIALVTSSRFRIRGRARQGSRGAAIADWLLRRPAMLLSVTLVGTNIFVVLASSLMTDWLGKSIGPYAVVVSTVAGTGLILLFGEIIPKSMTRNNPDGVLSRVAPGLGLAYFLLYPVARVVALIASLFVRLSSSVETSGKVTRDEIRAVVKDAAQARFGRTSHGHIHRVLDLSDIKVAELMVPMDEVICIDEESTVAEALEMACRSGHSRYPVFKRSPDNLVSILHLKDLLGVRDDLKIRNFARKAYFIPETKDVRSAIRDMREDLRHLAIVADEYGRAIGVLTFEDLVEEIMGEISDEYDQVTRKHIEMGQPISGNTPVSRIRAELDIQIPDGPYTTLAGFLLDQTGALCAVGETIEYDGFEFQVIETKGRRIRRVRITGKED
jgi:CBS domain containing-hemolysin-like protein